MSLASIRKWCGWFAALTVVVSGCERTGGMPPSLPTQNVGTWQVGLANQPDPARVGENTLTILARDSTGDPMRGDVDVVVSMAEMGAMPPMESRGRVKAAGNGTFKASYALPMGGEWDVAVRLRPRGGRSAEARYRLS